MRELRAYITLKRSRRAADNYLKRLRDFCEGLAIAPHQGETRPELKEDQKTIGFEHRITVIFRVYDDRELVRITGISYAGRSLNRFTP